MLGYPKDVEETVFGATSPQEGVLEHMKRGSILIDHTTSSPGLAERIALEGLRRGVQSIDAPVSGGDVGAKNGKLVIMMGGDADTIDSCLPMLNCYAAQCKNMG